MVCFTSSLHNIGIQLRCCGLLAWSRANSTCDTGDSPFPPIQQSIQPVNGYTEGARKARLDIELKAHAANRFRLKARSSRLPEVPPCPSLGCCSSDFPP